MIKSSKPKIHAESGYRGESISGDNGISTSGDYGLSISGVGGVVSSGECGTIILLFFDKASDRMRIVVGYPGEGGLRAGVRYRLNENREFEETKMNELRAMMPSKVLESLTAMAVKHLKEHATKGYCSDRGKLAGDIARLIEGQLGEPLQGVYKEAFWKALDLALANEEVVALRAKAKAALDSGK